MLRCANARVDNARPALTLEQSELSLPRPKVSGQFAYNHGKVPQRELAASDERYDPVAYATEDDLLPKEVFDREPKDPRFAPVFERRIENGYADAFRTLGLEKQIKGITSECKTLSCYTEVEVSKDDADAIYDRINGLVIGDMSSPGQRDGHTPDSALVTFYTVYSPQMRDDQAFNKFMQQVFAQLVANFKAEYEMTHHE